MKVRLNAHPSHLPKCLEGIDKGFGLYTGSDFYLENEGKNSHTKYISSLINSRAMKIFGGGSINEDSQVFLNTNANNIMYLKSKNENNFFQDLSIQLNVESKLNTKIAKQYEILSKNDSTGEMKEIVSRLSPNENYALSTSNKGAIVVSAGGGGDLHQTLTANFGQEKTFDFIFFHEMGHYIEKLSDANNFNKRSVPIDIFLNKLGRVVNLEDDITGKDISFSQKSLNLSRSLSSLDGELYADMTSIMIMRNKDIKEGKFEKEKTDNFIYTVKEARKLEYSKTSNNLPEDMNFYFTHSTPIGMDSFKEKVNNLGDKEISFKEMDKIAKEVQDIAIARAIYTLVKSANNFIPQLNTVFCLKFNEDTGVPYIDKENRAEKFIESMKEIKSIAGENWVKNFDKIVQDKVDAGNPLTKNEVFKMGFAHNENLSCLKQLENISIEQKTVKAEINPIENILAARAKFFSKQTNTNKLSI
jgi:hypothetical protein